MKRSLSSLICPSGFPGVFEDGDELVNGGDDDLFACVSGGGGGGGGGGFSGHQSEKKRRLSSEQVRALEKNFEVENKLEPERKVRLAQELGLQPRQVAVWFQNRRARWKTKQLERDFGALKSRYDSLRLDYDSLLRDKESLLAEVKDLNAKLAGEEGSFSSVKDERVAPDSENKAVEGETLTLIYNRDGSSDSDSSAVLNDENTPLIGFNGGGSAGAGAGGGMLYQPHVMKVEDGFLDGDEPCSFFADDLPPTLSWYCGDGWE